MNWRSFLYGLLLGGGGIKLIELAIVWARERREQKGSKVSHEKNRPRFRVDVTVDETTHSMRPTLLIKILSLGGLPLTINDGYVEVQSPDESDTQKPQTLAGKEISPSAPIDIQIPIRFRTLHPQERRETPVKLVTKFSHGDNETYENEQHYNEVARKFEQASH